MDVKGARALAERLGTEQFQGRVGGARDYEREARRSARYDELSTLPIEVLYERAGLSATLWYGRQQLIAMIIEEEK